MGLIALDTALEVAVYLLCVGLGLLLWLIGRSDRALWWVFCSFFCGYTGLIGFDLAYDGGYLSLAQYSFFRRIPLRIFPVLGVWGFLWWFVYGSCRAHDDSA